MSWFGVCVVVVVDRIGGRAVRGAIRGVVVGGSLDLH